MVSENLTPGLFHARGAEHYRAMLEDWSIDLAVGTATHNRSGLVLELVTEDPIWPLMRARPETVEGLVEQLLREGTIAFRHARNRGR